MRCAKSDSAPSLTWYVSGFLIAISASACAFVEITPIKTIFRVRVCAQGAGIMYVENSRERDKDGSMRARLAI